MTTEDVKKFWEKHKTKIAIGSAVAGAVIVKLLLDKKADPKVVKETVHKVVSKVEPMKVLVDPECKLGKLGFTEYEHYGHFAEMIADDPNRLPVSKLGELGEALMTELGMKPNDRVWLLINAEICDQ